MKHAHVPILLLSSVLLCGAVCMAEDTGAAAPNPGNQITASGKTGTIPDAPAIKREVLILSTSELAGGLPNLDTSKIRELHLRVSLNGRTANPDWTYERLAELNTPELTNLELSGFSGEKLVLPNAPGLKNLTIAESDLKDLSALEGVPVKTLTLRNLHQLKDFSTLENLQLEELNIRNVWSITWSKPSNLPETCVVRYSTARSQNPFILWTLYFIVLVPLAFWVFVIGKNQEVRSHGSHK